MESIVGYLRGAIAGLGSFGGGLGLFFIAFLDSSFISLPEINDLLIVYFCVRFKEQAYYYALMAALGSAAGCSVLYWLGRWKGYNFLRRRYSEEKLESSLRVFHRYGMLAVLGPALLPPPFPFKIFVLSSGVFGISYGRFLSAVLLGRGFRYLVEAAVAIRYGDQALAYLQENYLQLAIIMLTIIFGGLGAYVLVSYLRRRHRASSNGAPELNA